MVSGPGGSALASSMAGLSPLAALVGTGASNLDQTNALIWAMVAISAAGAIVTFAFLVYALWKFRDPHVKGRRYG